MSAQGFGKVKFTQRNQDSSLVRNQDFALLALLLCGGGEGLIHIEDVALRAYQLAPTRFKWERHDYPSLDTARVSLRADHGPQGVVQRTGSKLYSLTSEGLLRAIEAGNRLLGTNHVDPRHLIRAFALGTNIEPSAESGLDKGVTRSRPAQKDLKRIRAHEAFRAWVKDSTTSFELWQLADLLECMPDASPPTWDARLEHLKRQATFWQDAEILKFAERIEDTIRIALTTEHS